MQTRCHDSESSALLEFKEGFINGNCFSGDSFSYPKVSTWKITKGKNTNIDCCSWDGIDCDEVTDYVISLELSNSFLLSSMNSTNSLLLLVHIERLNLANNNINYSSIPTQLTHLSQLTYLNLLHSQFYGRVPMEIGSFSKLSSFDLSLNTDSVFNKKLLRLEGSSFRILIWNLTRIEYFSLAMLSQLLLCPNSL